MDIHKIPSLPRLENIRQTYAIDYGASVIKLLYKDEDGNLLVKNFAHESRQLLVDFIMTTFPASGKDVPIMVCTGSGMNTYRKQLENALSVKFQVESEMDCCIRAIRLFLKELSLGEMFWSIPKPAFEIATTVVDGFMKMGQTGKNVDNSEVKMMSDKGAISVKNVNTESINDRYIKYDLDQIRYPCIVTICGSGMLSYLVEDLDSPAKMIDYSSRSGKTLLGLASLLTGAQSYDEIIDLASKGNVSGINTYMKDVTGNEGDEWYQAFPDDGLTFCFGKAFKKSISDYKREDLAASVLNLVFDDMAHVSIATAISNNVKDVIFCGSMLNDPVARYHLSRNFLSRSLLLPKQRQVTLRMCKPGPFLGAIGAWMKAE